MADKAKFFTTLVTELNNIDGTSATEVLAADAVNDRLVNQILISTNDTDDHTAQLLLNNGSIDISLGVVTIPDGSGTNGTDAAVDIVAALATVFTRTDNAGNKCLELVAGFSLKVKMSAVTADKSYDVLVNAAQ